FQSMVFTVPGLIMHQTATLWLMLNVIRPLWGDRAAWRKPGIWHIVTAYIWISAPVLIAPPILLGLRGMPGPTIEANAPQALVCGWVSACGTPSRASIVRRVVVAVRAPLLGGSWLSLAEAGLGGVYLWPSVYV